jgi:hypothetical protein
MQGECESVKRYLISGLLLESDEEFPELPATTDASTPDIMFQVHEGLGAMSDSAEPYHQWNLPDGQPWLHLAKSDGQFHLRFLQYADFILDAEKRIVICRPQMGASHETVRHLFLNQVMPLLLSKLGKLVLHAGAVSTHLGAVAFVGQAGVGKSTLTAGLGRVCPVLTDDCLMVEWDESGPLARGNYPGIRLWPDVLPHFLAGDDMVANVAQYTSKRRISGSNGAMTYEGRSVPLRRLYMLQRREADQPSRQISITKLRSAEGVIALLKYTFLLDIDDREQSARHLQLFKKMVDAGLVRGLSYPSGISLIPAIHEAILEDLASSCGNAL